MTPETNRSLPAENLGIHWTQWDERRVERSLRVEALINSLVRTHQENPFIDSEFLITKSLELQKLCSQTGQHLLETQDSVDLIGIDKTGPRDVRTGDRITYHNHKTINAVNALSIALIPDIDINLTQSPRILITQARNRAGLARIAVDHGRVIDFATIINGLYLSVHLLTLRARPRFVDIRPLLKTA